MKESREDLLAVVEAALAERFPDVEVVDVELRGSPAATLTVYIDRPEGVDLDLCAAVSQALDDLRERFVLEVSSPGLDRRLRKPAHFAAAIGEEVVVKLTIPQGGRRTFRGVLVAAEADSIIVESGGERARLPLAALAKAHVVYDFAKERGHRE